MKFPVRFLTAVSLLLSFSTSSFADVTSGGKYSSEYTEVIHIVMNDDQTITFQYCEGPNLTECRLLGNKPKYKMRDLQRKEEFLKKQRRAMIVSDATYLVGSALAGIIFTVSAPTPVGVAGFAIYAASGAAGTTVVLLKSFIDPTKDGPMAKLKAPRTLSATLLSGQAVQVNMPINDFAQQMDETLKSIF